MQNSERKYLLVRWDTVSFVTTPMPDKDTPGECVLSLCGMRVGAPTRWDSARIYEESRYSRWLREL